MRRMNTWPVAVISLLVGVITCWLAWGAGGLIFYGVVLVALVAVKRFIGPHRRT